MKTRVLLPFVFCILLFSCKKESAKDVRNSTPDSLEIYSEADYFRIKYGRIKVVDTACINETARARADIGRDKLTYFHIKGFSARDVSDRELTALLGTHDIGFQKVFSSCIPPPPGFQKFCYQETVNAEIARRFGPNFIDSLRKVADEKFIRTHRDFLFSSHECEITSRYAKIVDYNESLKTQRSDFLAYFSAADKSGKIKLESLDVAFVIRKDASVGSIRIEKKISPDTPENQHFADSIVTSFITKTKWKPALFNGIPVNSDWHLDIH